MEALRLVSEGFLLLSGTPALSALEFAEAARRRRGCWCSSRLDVDEGAGARRGRSSTRGGGVLPGWLDVDEERRGARRGWWRSSRAVAARRAARRRGRWVSRWRVCSTLVEGGSGSSRWLVGDEERRWLVEGGRDAAAARRRGGWWRCRGGVVDEETAGLLVEDGGARRLQGWANGNC